MSYLARVIATVFGAGLSPIAPGTVGTAAAVPMVWLASGLPLWVFTCITAATIVLGIWAANGADRHWGTHDSGRIVVDEVAGYFVTMALIDRGDWLALGVAFVVFRFFDIVKPPPVRAIDESLGGGAGVVLDDVAGIYGLLVMLAGAYFDFWALSLE